jgi:glycosyltransferase involved in cell wall biosynthesis
LRRERPEHKASLVVLSVLAGLLAGLLVEATLWMTSVPGRGFGDAFQHIGDRTTGPSASFVFAALGGGLIGFALGGRRWGTHQSAYMARVVGTMLILACGAVIGTGAGIIAYSFLWLGAAPDQNAWRIFTHVFESIQRGNPFLTALIVAGSVIGVASVAFALGNDVIQRMMRGIVGMTIGSFGGLLIYCIGFVAVNNPQGPSNASYLIHFGAAIYSASPLEFAFIAFGAFLGLLMARYSWRFYGVMTLLSLVSVVVGFLLYSFLITLPKVDPAWRWFSRTLFIAEAISLSMVVIYAFYTIDVATRKQWRKNPNEVRFSPFFAPKLAFQVCCFNEPPQLVFDTMDKLRQMEYPSDRFLIQCLDDSTKEELAQPLQEYCERHGIQYIHRLDRKGFKAGALNNALEHTPPDVDFIAVVDADYQIEPDFLKEVMGYFVDRDLAWLQTPQDYRNRDQSFLTEQYYLSDAYFYRTVMPSRNEENTIIFCGTMGILRRKALEEVGGWGEKYISEDAELSLRLLSRGWQSLYINKTFGRGLIPPTFEGYKKQHYRWAFGGAKILRGHFFKILFGRLSRRQRFDYFVSGIHWFEGLLVIIVSMLMIVLAVGELTGLRVVTHHSQEILLVGLIPLFLLTDGITRLHMVMRESMKLRLNQTTKVLGMWFSVKFSNAFGAAKSMLGFHMPFVRTPKAPTETVAKGEALRRAIRVTRFETTMATIMVVLVVALLIRIATLSTSGIGALTRLFLAAWMTYYFFVYASAPVYAYKSYVTFVPDDELEARSPRLQGPSPGLPRGRVLG